MPASLLPKLPAKAAYILLNNPSRRNALSLSILEDLHSQLVRALTSPLTGRLLVLPPFRPSLLPKLEAAAAAATAATKSAKFGSTTTTAAHRAQSEQQHHRPTPDATPALSEHHGHHHTQPSTNPPRNASSPPLNNHEKEDDDTWLVSPATYARHHATLPSVLVLRSTTPSLPIFSSGHDLRELSTLSPQDIKRTFALCAEVMSMIHRSPIPIICPIHGLATAAGLQLALSADYVLARSDSAFQLPGARLGLPCTSPATAAVRRLSVGLVARMLLSAEPVAVSDPAVRGSGAVDVVEPEKFEERVAEVVETVARGAGQNTALGKWAFWTQVGMRGGGGSGGDCFSERGASEIGIGGRGRNDEGVVGVGGGAGDSGGGGGVGSGGGGGGGGDGYEEAARWAGRVMVLHARSDDAREGMAAFLEKRKPVFMT